jgi:hypothetical protein
LNVGSGGEAGKLIVLGGQVLPILVTLAFGASALAQFRAAGSIRWRHPIGAAEQHFTQPTLGRCRIPSLPFS